MTINLRPGERIDQLYSQKIQIIQSPDVFSFSLDAVLLANFAKGPAKGSGQLIDLCAGNGAVGLFMAPKTRGHISLVEIQPRLAEMATRSVELNQLESKITVYNHDLKTIDTLIPKDTVDVVTCNPPYFANLPNSQKNPNDYLAIARHEIKATLADIVTVSSGLLKMNGKAFFVYRPDRLFELTTMMTANRLSPKRLQFVFPKPDRAANMVLIEAIKDGKETGLTILPPLVTYEANGEYSKEVELMLYGSHHA